MGGWGREGGTDGREGGSYSFDAFHSRPYAK